MSDERVRVELLDRQGRVRDRWRVEPARVDRWMRAQNAAHSGWHCHAVNPNPQESLTECGTCGQPIAQFVTSGGSDA